MTNFEELKWRGLIKDTAGEDIEEKINKGPSHEWICFLYFQH